MVDDDDDDDPDWAFVCGTDNCDRTPLLIVVGVIGRMPFELTIGDSRFERESIVRGEADGDGIAGGM